MAFDRFKGQAREAAGRAQETAGNSIGDDGLKAEGLSRNVGGQAQDLYGAAKAQARGAAEAVFDAASDAREQGGDYAQHGAKAVANSVKDYPISALLLAGALGFLACLLIGPRG